VKNYQARWIAYLGSKPSHVRQGLSESRVLLNQLVHRIIFTLNCTMWSGGILRFHIHQTSTCFQLMIWITHSTIIIHSFHSFTRIPGLDWLSFCLNPTYELWSCSYDKPLPRCWHGEPRYTCPKPQEKEKKLDSKSKITLKKWWCEYSWTCSLFLCGYSIQYNYIGRNCSLKSD